MGGAAASKPAGGSSSGGADGADGADGANGAELARLRREVADLRRQLAAAGSGGGEKEDAWPRPAEGVAAATLTAHAAHEAHARDVHAEHEHHERKLALKMKARQRASRKSLNARLAARLRVKQTKALQKVPIFASLSDDVISALVDKMEYQIHDPGSVLCNQGDVAEHFYIIVQGECHVIVKKDKTTKVDQFGDTQTVAESEVEVGILRELDFFGEAALFDQISGSDVGSEESGEVGAVEKRLRTASVRVGIEYQVKILRLHRDDFDSFVNDGKIDGEAVFKVRKIGMDRQKRNVDRGLREKDIFSWTPQQTLPGEKKNNLEDEKKKKKKKPANESEANPPRPAVPKNAQVINDVDQTKLEKAERERNHAQAAEVAALQKFYAANAQIKALEAQVQLLQTQHQGGSNSGGGGPAPKKNPRSIQAVSDTAGMAPVLGVSLGPSVGSTIREKKADQDAARSARMAKLEEMRKRTKSRANFSKVLQADQQDRQDAEDLRMERIASRRGVI